MCGQELPKANIQTARNQHKPPAFPSSAASRGGPQPPLVNHRIQVAPGLPFCPRKDARRVKEYRNTEYSAGLNRSVEPAFVLLQEGKGKSV